MRPSETSYFSNYSLFMFFMVHKAGQRLRYPAVQFKEHTHTNTHTSSYILFVAMSLVYSLHIVNVL